MIPTAWVTLDAFPLTPNRKVDRNALPAPEGRRVADETYRAPRGETEQAIAAIWEEVLGESKIGVRDNFFDRGGHSLLLLQVHAKLTDQLGVDIGVVDLFQYPTVESLATFLSGADPRNGLRVAANARVEKRQGQAEGENWIAVVGLAGRFPGAANVDEYWANLKNGVESITTFTAEELRSTGIGDKLLASSRYVRARPELRDVDQFDASFFGYSPREAEVIDPQQRLFLECSWQALESAAYDPERFDGLIGVFAGTGINTYLLQLPLDELTSSVGPMQVMIGNDKDFLPTRVSYKLNLRGPSMSVQTACSTSLVAVHLACKSLRDQECDLALAGGVTVNASGLAKGYLYQEEGIASPDGHCRTFDVDARGTLFGDGVGIVVLKRLSEALADGDAIHSVIRGSAINNDGSAKVGYTAPSVEGQAEVIALALADAQVEPQTLGYVEAHGTGTPLGDPIELKALTRVMREETDDTGFCGIGSVKTNFGHLDAAAGIAGLIKTVLALENRYLPPSLHFREPNPEIGLDSSPFYVTAEGAPWSPAAAPRRAGVSSFGIGGTNCHVVLEEAPMSSASASSRSWHLLPLSARTETALEAAATRLADHLGEHPDTNLADIAYTLQVGRHGFGRRRFAVCQDIPEAVRLLRQPGIGRQSGAPEENRDPSLVFLFPGQGSQYVGMGAELYEHEGVFREAFDRCAEGLIPHIGVDLRDIVFRADADDEEAAARLRQTAITQPSLFAVEYALAALWSQWGLRPTAMIGHSIGEYVAACLSNVFTLDAVLSLVAARGRMMQELPAGSMLSVALPEAEVVPWLNDSVSVAAINAPSHCVVSGPTAVIDDLARELDGAGIGCRRLHTSHAFHSSMMDPILEEFARRVTEASPAAPEIPFVSNVTGTWISDEDATDPAYWARHLRQAVRFSAGIETLLEDGASVLLEVGPGTMLSSLTKLHEQATRHVAVSSLRPPQSRASDQAILLEALGRLWAEGASVDWRSVYGTERRRRIPLPTYPFERQRFWLSGGSIASSSATTTPALTKSPDVGDWFYGISWRRTADPVAPEVSTSSHEPWLLLLDDAGLDAGVGAGLEKRLIERGHRVITVRPGDDFREEAEDRFVLRPTVRGDFDALLDHFATPAVPRRIVHLWCLGEESPGGRELFLERGFHSLVFLAHAVSSRLDPGSRGQIDVIADGLWDVTGDEPIVPAKAPLVASCKVIPQEYANLTSRWIDLEASNAKTNVDRVFRELHAPVEAGVAFRGRHRWVQDFEPTPLASSTGAAALVRDGGVYLITGGMGRIGLAIARLLAENEAVKLVLTGRSALPDRAAWDDWIREHQDGTARKIGQVRELESLGAEVLVLAADVTNEGQMRAAVASAVDRFGAVHGVIHAAGEVAFAAVSELDADTIQPQLAAKICGVRVLDAVIPERDLDFVLLASSLAAVLGGIGQAAYAAANLYLDAFAEARNRTASARWISLKWDAWAPEATDGHGDRPLAMSTAEGLETVRRLLAIATPPTQPIVSTVDLAGRVDEWIVRSPSEQTPAEDGATDEAVGRSIKGRLDDAPPSERKELVTEYLCRRVVDLLGHGRAETDQPLLNLGLDSLMAVQLRNTLSNDLGIELSVAVFLDGASIDSLSDQIAEQSDAPAEVTPAATAREQVESDPRASDELLGRLDDLSAEDVDALLETIDDRWGDN